MKRLLIPLVAVALLLAGCAERATTTGATPQTTATRATIADSQAATVPYTVRAQPTDQPNVLVSLAPPSLTDKAAITPVDAIKICNQPAGALCPDIGAPTTVELVKVFDTSGVSGRILTGDLAYALHWDPAGCKIDVKLDPKGESAAPGSVSWCHWTTLVDALTGKYLKAWSTP